MPRLENEVGFKAGLSARDAAESQIHRAPIIRTMVLHCLERAGRPLSADEIAEHIGIDFISVRPRVSELHEKGLVRDSGTRRPSRYGRLATGWELTPQPETGDLS